MQPRKSQFLSAAVLLFGLYSAVALTGTPPVLTNAVRSGDQFQFTLRGETNVSYIIESSSDLSTWTPALTNSDWRATRTVTVPAAAGHGFWRGRPVPSPLFEYAILARSTVTLGGSGRIDSFNSTNAVESGPDGQYDPARATDRATVATVARTNPAISVGNMKIYGSVATGPGATVTLSPNGIVGSTAYNNSPANNGTIQPGHYTDNVNVYVPPATLPNDFGPALILPQNVLYPPVGGTNYKYAILEDGDYRVFNSISLGIGEKMLINARARLHVMGNTTLSSSGYILLGSDASIEWYGGGQVSLGGGGCINNSGRPVNFSIFGLTSAPISYSGNTRLIGRIYAPFAPVSLAGTLDAVGAIVCNTFTLTGTMGLHFDESLRHAGPFY